MALIHSDLLGDRPLEDTEKFRFRMRLPVVFSFTSHTVFSCPNQGPDRNSLLRLSRHKAERMEIILPGLLVHCPLLCVFPATLSVPLPAVVDLVNGTRGVVCQALYQTQMPAPLFLNGDSGKGRV